MIRIIEGPLILIDADNMDYTVIQNCIWNVVVTMTTVGYGDYYPKTNLGRFIMIASVLTGTTLVSFMIVALNNFMKFSNHQLKVNICR